MGCFDDLMQFRDEVDLAEKNIRWRSRSYGLKDLQRRDRQRRRVSHNGMLPFLKEAIS
jgi:hypothetical protein